MNTRRSAGPLTTNVSRSPPIVGEPRRANSTSKLGALFRGETQNDGKLMEALNDLAITSKLTLKAAECQRRGAAKLADWAKSSRNAAIDDVMGHTNAIFQIHGEKMNELARSYEYSLQQLKKMSHAEKAVMEAEKKASDLEEKEKRIMKELYPSTRRSGLFTKRRSTGSVNETLRNQLVEVQREREHAQWELSKRRADMEVVKMIWFRNGMQGIADAYVSYCTTATAIFGCHREITELVPAVSTQDVTRMVYEGTPIARERVEQLKRSLDSPHEIAKLTQQASQLLGNPRRRSEPMRRQVRDNREVRESRHGTPPPPYTPTAPLENTDRTPVSSRLPSHLHPIVPPLSQSSLPPPSLISLPSHLHVIPPNNGTPSALAQLASRDTRRENRRSLPPCVACSGRLYPELPPNPYVSARETRD